MKNWLCQAWITRLAVAFVTATSLAACTGVGPYNSSSDGADKVLMLNGHDPVAYFTVGKHTLGKAGITAMHAGATFLAFRIPRPAVPGDAPRAARTGGLWPG